MRHYALRVGASCILMAASLLAMTGLAQAQEGAKLCVPDAPGRPIVTPNSHGECANHGVVRYKLMDLGKEGPAGPQGKEGPAGPAGPEGRNALSAEELETLREILPCTKFVASGIDGKPTIQFSGCNVQIVNGEGKTASTNGEGNLVIGYDESPGEQTGSHNLILGEGQRFTSYGGIDAGQRDTISAPFASVTGGDGNTASSAYASVTGGNANTASGERSWVGGGVLNAAAGGYASVGGGFVNTASGEFASVSGGSQNAASGFISWIGGGFVNKAKGRYSSIFGGHREEATGEFEAKP